MVGRRFHCRIAPVGMCWGEGGCFLRGGGENVVAMAMAWPLDWVLPGVVPPVQQEQRVLSRVPWCPCGACTCNVGRYVFLCGVVVA